MILPPILGLIPTFIAMIRAFRVGDADPEVLASYVSVSLRATAWGLAVSSIAFLVFIAVLIRFFTLPKLSAASPLTVEER